MARRSPSPAGRDSRRNDRPANRDGRDGPRSGGAPPPRSPTSAGLNERDRRYDQQRHNDRRRYDDRSASSRSHDDRSGSSRAHDDRPGSTRGRYDDRSDSGRDRGGDRRRDHRHSPPRRHRERSRDRYRSRSPRQHQDPPRARSPPRRADNDARSNDGSRPTSRAAPQSPASVRSQDSKKVEKKAIENKEPEKKEPEVKAETKEEKSARIRKYFQDKAAQQNDPDAAKASNEQKPAAAEQSTSKQSKGGPPTSSKNKSKKNKLITLGSDVVIPQSKARKMPPKPPSPSSKPASLPSQTSGGSSKVTTHLNVFSGKKDKDEGTSALSSDDEEKPKALSKMKSMDTHSKHMEEDGKPSEEPIGNDEDTVFDPFDSDEAGNESEDGANSGAEESGEAELQDKKQQARNQLAEHRRRQAPQPDAEGDTAMADQSQDGEVDPLDAYMAELNKQSTAPGSQSQRSIKDTSAVTFDLDGDDQTAVENDEIIAGNVDKRKSRLLQPVDHSTIDYPSFNKNFYKEPYEVSLLTEAEVEQLRERLDNITIWSKDKDGKPPRPVLKWSLFGLTRPQLNMIENTLKFEQPTSIQSQAIPCILSGRDIIGIARTGSGKTLAFLLPLFRHVMDQPPLGDRDGPIALILAPTRELAMQINNDCTPWCNVLGLFSVCVYGGSRLSDQIDLIKKRPHIVVGTPGRWTDLLLTNKGRLTNLRRVTYVVLDEADRMFDHGFEPQIINILRNVRPDRQVSLFSATFPRVMEALAVKVLNNPYKITVSGVAVVASDIEQIVEVRPEPSKINRVLKLLGELPNHDTAKVLIFVEKQDSAEELFKVLRQRHYVAGTLHGGKEQSERAETIKDFKDGALFILIATSVASRGLDVKDLKLVINYDCPSHMEDYVHRVGRTGRAGNKGTAVTFVTPEQTRLAGGIIKALEMSKQTVPEDLKALKTQHDEYVKNNAGSVTYNRGFGGRGIEEHGRRIEAAKQAERKMYGVEDKKEEPEEVDEDGDLIIKPVEEKLEEIKVEKKPEIIKESKPAKPADGQIRSIDMDAAIQVHKTEREDPRSFAGMTPMQRVLARNSSITDRLRKGGDVRSAAPIDNKGPDAGAFHATLELNDYVQKARWAVTNRTNVAKILESTGASITNKGQQYGPGDGPKGPSDPPKLYVLIEGDSEAQVRQATMELRLLLKEAIDSEKEGGAREPPRAGGSY